jgi:hypothetical protein
LRPSSYFLIYALIEYDDAMTKLKAFLPLTALLLLSLSPIQSQTPPTLQGDPAHPPQTTNWVETHLFFGLSPADAPNKAASEAAWRNFLDREVTPRFPSGLSVLDVYGQWQGKQEKAPERERSKLLIIDYPATPDNAARIEAIRTAWKQRTHAQSVLKVTQPADVSF